MIVQEIFDTKVVRVKCDNYDWYQDKGALANLEKAFKLAESASTMKAQERMGKFETLMGGGTPIQFIPGFENLMTWISNQIMKASPYFVDFTPSKFRFVRTWANKMFQGAQGKAHIHNVKSVTGVAIFYLQVPENSADLVFIDTKNKDMKAVDDYSKHDVIYVNIQEGELLFHDNQVMHAITEHKNEIPRICLVFEFEYLQ